MRPATRQWLTRRCEELLATYHQLDFILSAGHVHGDAYPGNVLQAGTGYIPGDWEETATGQRELDLVNTFQGVRYGRTPDELQRGTRVGSDSIRRLTAVTTMVKQTDAVMSLWADDVIAELPDIAKPQQLVNIVTGWRGPMIPDPVFVARGPAHERPEATITHPPPDTTNGEHHPYRPRADFGSNDPSTVACHDCHWAQLVDGELLYNGAELLAAWHSAYPDCAVNHLSVPTDGLFAIPDYITWQDHHEALLAIDERAGLIYRRKAIDLAVYKAADTGRSLAGSKPAVQRAIADLYRWGLLVPRSASAQGLSS